jgi:hypothetical protein
LHLATEYFHPAILPRDFFCNPIAQTFGGRTDGLGNLH